ncbi:MAG: FapA family protein [Treponema sp.]|nr:FapA family protein [Treponema sp.]
MENTGDGKIVLHFLNNDLEAWGDFYPAMGDGRSISTEYINALLEQSDIVYGINEDEIHQAYKLCVEKNEIVRNVCIARGTAPVNEVPEYLQLNPQLNSNRIQRKTDDAIDYRAKSPFIVVKKDQILARVKPAQTGNDGTNVHGLQISYKTSKPDDVTGGDNTRLEGGLLLSNINGQLDITRKVVNVKDSMHIKGSVGYSTGNIIFPGDVTIDGSVSDGFKIYSGGTINIKQTFDITDVIAKADLNVAGGIIGRGMALVKVGGTLKTKFIENCRVACRGDIAVDLGIINSHVYTLEHLAMGEKGRIIGGEIYALKGVKTGGIGKKDGKASKVYCGLDFSLEQEKEKYNSILRNTAVKLNRLRDLLAEAQGDSEKTTEMNTLYQRLEAEQEEAQKKVTELLGVVNTYEEAMVEVSGDIVAGAYIEICKISMTVMEPLKKVRIRLDKQNNRLITEALPS